MPGTYAENFLTPCKELLNQNFYLCNRFKNINQLRLCIGLWNLPPI